MSEWQPIETAPKDGTHILIATPGRSVLIAYWREEALFERFEKGAAWQVFDCEDGWYSWAEKEATHWMPLPEAPKP